MDKTLKKKTVSALIWSLMETVGLQSVQFIIGITLARLLMPSEFGLIAMLLVFIAIAQTFVDSGFGAALIQRQNITQKDECSVFYFNIFAGVVAAILLCLSAPAIADFYNQPMLIPLTQALSINLIINSFGIVQMSLLEKRLEFKELMKVSMIAAVISGVGGIALAFNGYGVWSLVFQSIVSNLIRVILPWVFMPWRPAWMFSFTSLKAMFPFTSKLLISGLLTTIFENLYIIVIGKLFSPVALGFYSRAKNLQMLPTMILTKVVYRVTFPVFSVMQDDKPQLKRAVRKAIMTMMTGHFPVMIGLSIVAEPLILVLLTEKWLPAAPYLQLLCIVGILYPLHAINVNILRAQGRADLSLFISICKKVLATIAILITWRWGITAMIYGQIVSSILAYYLNTYFTGKLLSYPMLEQVKDILPVACLSVVMGIAVYFVGELPYPNTISLLAAQIATGMLIYAGLCYVAKIGPFMDVLKLLNKRAKRADTVKT